LQFVQQFTSSTEFLEWAEYLNQQETETVKREEYYWAQIAAEVRRSWVKHKQKIKLTDFLIKFSYSKKPKILTAQEKEMKLQKSKNFWLMATGFLKKGK
jgi:hypothetical protein